MLAFSPVSAKESLSSYFVKITDASQALKNGNQEEAKALVREMATDFEKVEHADSDAGRVVKEKLALSGEISEENLTQISSALLAFEKEQKSSNSNKIYNFEKQEVYDVTQKGQNNIKKIVGVALIIIIVIVLFLIKGR